MKRIKLKSNNPFGSSVTSAGIKIFSNCFIEIEDEKFLEILPKLSQFLEIDTPDITGEVTAMPGEMKGFVIKDDKPKKEKTSKKNKATTEKDKGGAS